MPDLDIRNQSHLIFEDLLASAMEQNNPTVIAGYPMTNMDIRDANIPVRLDMLAHTIGIATAPLEIKFDLSDMHLIEAVALANCNIDASGGVIVQLGKTDGDIGTWEETHNLFHNYRNLLANPDCEDYIDLTSPPNDPAAEPVDGTVELKGFVIVPGSGDCVVMAKAYLADSDKPDELAKYVNRVYGDFRYRQIGAVDCYVATVSQFGIYNVGDVIDFRFDWRMTATSGIKEVLIFEFSDAFALLNAVSIKSYSGSYPANWEEVIGQYVVTNANCRYIAIILKQDGAATINDSIQFDNFRMSINKEVEDFISAMVKTSLDRYIFKRFDHTIPAQFIKFILVNGWLLSASVDDYVEFGRILIGKCLSYGVQRGLSRDTLSGYSVELTSGNSPIEIKNKGQNKSFNCSFRAFKRGEASNIVEVLESLQGNQVFYSLFGESGKDRAILGNITSGVKITESSIKNIVDVNFSVVRES